MLQEALSKTRTANGDILYNGAPKAERKFYPVGRMSRIYLEAKELGEHVTEAIY